MNKIKIECITGGQDQEEISDGMDSKHRMQPKTRRI